ncbi:chromophore lyase CpcT/CpeT [Flavobacterium sp.]|uniref:chromophore lyase CpcT/CpeT n=1 Tax=Flavobacterium sp. TaxID=239 RepID=UPI00260E2404|nr:chromophore lyase CpcT/CpeT [Flavobacterium sp.]
MRYVFFTFCISLFLLGCKSAQSPKNTDSSVMKELVTIMQGHYSSEKQASQDKDYFNISLRMTPIWKSKGHYLFVEQALFDKQNQPYRVRIYKLTQQGDQFISTIYTLKDEKKWIGKWATPEAYDQLTEADIEIKDGCEVILKRTAKNTFEGATGDKTCPSELRGARWANSKVTVTHNSILSWDQGFDKDGKQVWGATKGGYEFIKL